MTSPAGVTRMSQPCSGRNVLPLPRFVVSAVVVFAGIVADVTSVGPGELSCTVTGVSFVVTLMVIVPERLTMKLYQSVSPLHAFAETVCPRPMAVAVAGVSFGSKASPHGAAAAPCVAVVVTKTYDCGAFTVTLLPVMTAL